MAIPLSADRLLAALRAEGVRCVEYESWRTNNRNHRGPWGPVHGVMLHHTVTSGTAGSVELCYAGHSALPGPLCHGVIAKDGTCYLVGHGRANHAGTGDGDVLRAVIDEAPLPPDNGTGTDGNRYFYGFECVNRGDGADPWPAAQVDAMVRASAALCRAHGWGQRGGTSVIGHLEWQPGKIDPRPSPGGADVAMPVIRARVAERLAHQAGWDPADGTRHEEDDMPTATAEEIWDHKIRSRGRDVPARVVLDSARTNSITADARSVRALRELAALRAAVERLTDAVGSLAGGREVDLEELRAGIRDAIRAGVEDVTVRLDVTDGDGA